MIITEIKFYQLPYNYSSMDRFYRKDGVVDLPEPIRTITEDFKTHLSYINNTFLTSTMNIKGDVNFNYIEITGEMVAGDETTIETSYWFVEDNELIRPKYNKLNLRKDILTTFDLIKNTPDDVGTDEKIKITRKIFNNFKINENGTSISYIDERNPHIWNNQEYSRVIPQEKTVKPFAITEVLIATDKTFKNGNVQYKVPKNLRGRIVKLSVPFTLYTSNNSNDLVEIDKGGNEYFYQMWLPLSPLISLLNEILDTSNYTNPGTNLSHLATLNIPYENESLETYAPTTQIPVIYKSLFPIEPERWFSTNILRGDVVNAEHNTYDYQVCNYPTSYQARNITKDRNTWMEIINDKLIDGYRYTCPWGNTIDLRSPEFMAIMKHILTGFHFNTVESIANNLDVNTVDAYTDWMSSILKDIGNDNDIIIDINDMFPSMLIEETIPNVIDSDGDEGWLLTYRPTYSYHQQIKSLSSIDQDKYNSDLEKKVNLNISNSLLTNWDNYKYLAPQLFSTIYNYNYIDIIGNQLPLDNYKLYNTSSLLVQTWIGTSEQNISYYQGVIGDNGEILEPRYAQKYALAQSIEFSKNTAEITYQLRKNQTDAKISETQLSNARENTFLKGITNSKIAQGNSLTDIDRRLNQENTNTQTAFNTNTKDIGRGRTAAFKTAKEALTVAGSVSLFRPDSWVKGALGVAGSAILGGIEYDMNKAIDAEKVVAENARLQQNTDNLNRAISDRNDTNNRALRTEQNANIVRNNNSAQSQRLLIEAEIADIKNIPNQTMNVSNITKMLSIEKGEISLINESINEFQQKEMFYYWNKYGITNWMSLSTRNDWFKEFSLYDFFQGGDWTKYLNGIGIYNIEIINEFNVLMSNGLRLHHQSEIYEELEGLELVNSPNDINHNIPNWPKTITDILFNPAIDKQSDDEVETLIIENDNEESNQALLEYLERLRASIPGCEVLNSALQTATLSLANSNVDTSGARIARLEAELVKAQRLINHSNRILNICAGGKPWTFCYEDGYQEGWRATRVRNTERIATIQEELATLRAELLSEQGEQTILQTELEIAQPDIEVPSGVEPEPVGNQLRLDAIEVELMNYRDNIISIASQSSSYEDEHGHRCIRLEIFDNDYQGGNPVNYNPRYNKDGSCLTYTEAIDRNIREIIRLKEEYASLL